jgi:hypothetical protein
VLKQASNTFAASDEINQLALSDDESMLAAVDDGGHVLLFSASSVALHRRIENAHVGGEPPVSLCVTGIAFLPMRKHEWVSCGTDCAWRYWKLLARSGAHTDARATRVCNAPPVTRAAGNDSARLINPPYANAIAAAADGRHVALALGDGRVVVDAVEANSSGAFTDAEVIFAHDAAVNAWYVCACGVRVARTHARVGCLFA